SPSMWWTPERTSRPGLFSETDTSWVSEHLLSAPPQGVRISLCVGSLEGSTVPHVQQLHQRLITAGVESHCAIYTGGHDYAWWRGALIDGIGLLQG
ncbi:alpha/beta hydrolase-fold protein, partial [Escherichia coli]